MAETVGIVGAGALGSLLALRLARAGHLVLVLTRSEERRAALRRELHSGQVERDPEVLRPASILFLCVKSYDTEDAARTLARLAPSVPGICSLQNGWDHMEAIEAALPDAPLLVGATALGAYFDPEGVLHGSTAGATALAPWGRTEARWVEYAATVLESAGFRTEQHENARAVLWRKLALNAAVNPLTGLLDRPNGALLDQPALLRVAEEAAREAARVGVRLGFVPSDFDPAAKLASLLQETRSNRSSMAEDLLRGRRTEADAILGPILRGARETGEEAPVTASLLVLIRVAEAAFPW